MALILNIDTSTEICSVALANDGKIIGLKENSEGLNHSLLLGTYVDELLKENNIETRQLDAVSVSMGPGSYTGLRIGVSLAKGLCFGASKPLIAVNTLQALAWSVSDRLKEDAWYCPMIDARRMEVYTAFYDQNNHTQIETKAEIIDSESFKDILEKHKVYFFGNGSDKVQEVLTASNAHFLADIKTSATNMVALSEARYKAKQFEDVAYFEPFYLKDFIATTPKSRLL
ncbi:tRNA (adenosine(37)-N6)-threonylcarbamoyltransferase complex dimerization subunit type 1 TsaB [Porphyromonadaceae bacterium OttesenSCG-928-L07]|nr:tRNA (adenosine(37)-N6)-threonylcarbamoyltransferase complex dimerization subunit type 1 TsaB [Porphyromonadaceae bacterium OttesenSCG-928-L07]MDL2330579.1 tRNA (adenosine(37)-N6)-threonylcarbamoyltransferase complex dimerization subunit type 1 TsaB [Odoribacter sp. OttesenSCG-928-A06]